MDNIAFINYIKVIGHNNEFKKIIKLLVLEKPKGDEKMFVDIRTYYTDKVIKYSVRLTVGEFIEFIDSINYKAV